MPIRSHPTKDLGRREREILEIVYRLGRAAVSEVRAQMAAPPSYSAVRTMLNLLESKGYLHHRRDGLRYVYLPVTPKEKAGVSALRHLVDTFFGGSIESVVQTLLAPSRGRPTDAELRRLNHLISDAVARSKRA
jgi:predicted transcriptional regulator